VNGYDWFYADGQGPHLNGCHPRGHRERVPANDLAGNNLESSSEALNYDSALIPWGEATGDKSTRDLGVYLYTTELAVMQTAWFKVNNTNAFPHAYTTYSHPTTVKTSTVLTLVTNQSLPSLGPSLMGMDPHCFAWPLLCDGPGQTCGFSEQYLCPDVPEDWARELMAFNDQVGAKDDVLTDSVQRGLRGGVPTQCHFLIYSEHLVIHFQKLVLAALSSA
jgi:hypothetical protein